MIVCIGPTGAGKTLLLKKIQDPQLTDETSSSVSTVGTNIFNIKWGNSSISVRELGGAMAPLWSKYFDKIWKVMYVMDASNLCQISAAGVLLYEVLSHPQLQKAKFILVLTKMDVSYRQMRNEALLMLQIKQLKEEIKQELRVVEASGITGEGRDEIIQWLFALH